MSNNLDWPANASNPLGTFTIFDTVTPTPKQAHEYPDKPWSEIVRRVGNPLTANAKSDLRLISFCEYGDKLTDKGCIRHAENVKRVYGIEIDYDLEIMPIGKAQELMQANRLEAVLYTSPSHKPDKPRWRILLPLSEPCLPADRKRFVGRVNKLLSGVVSRESFSLSQSFYIGQVAGVTYEVRVSHGRCIDQADEIEPLYYVDQNNDGKSTRDATTDEQLRSAFKKGGDRYQSMVKLSARLAARGMSLDDMLAFFYALIDESGLSPKNRDGINLRKRVPEVCASAYKKFGESRKQPEDFEDGPPCLQYLATNGFPDTSKKAGLFNIGVFLKKRFPDDWEAMLRKYADKFFKPALAEELLAEQVKGLKRKEYNYGCTKLPIMSHCNKVLCRTRLFGVGKEDFNIAIDEGSIFKIMSDPPYWVVGIGGKRVELTAEHLQSQQLFAKVCMEKLNYFPGKLSVGRWREIINNILDSATPVTAAKEASATGELEFYLDQFLTAHATAETKEEIITGKPFHEEGMAYFRYADFKRYLDANHFSGLKGIKIYAHLRTLGVVDKQLWAGDKAIRVWAIKTDSVSAPELPPRRVQETTDM